VTGVGAPRIAVVGAGMSGVATAHFLERHGYQVEVLEAASFMGGRASSAELVERTIDIGGKNIGRGYRRFRQFLQEHGSPPLEYFGISSSTWRGGRLRTVDSKRKLASALNVLGLVGPNDFVRLARLARLVQQHPEEGMLGGPAFSRLSEEKDHLPLSAWFGAGTVADFLRPITLRMNGAEPEAYFLGCLGSNLKMVLDSYDQLSLGMSELFDRFVRRVPVTLGARVTELLWCGRRVVGVKLERAGRKEQRRYDGVVLALPAPAAARLLAGESIAPALDKVHYNPVTLVVARYRRPVFTPKVRAIVFDRASPLSNAGAYGVNDVDIVRYTLSGHGARKLGLHSDPAEVVALAEAELGRVVEVRPHERIDFVYRHFPHGLCAYGAYHHRFLRELVAWEATAEGVSLTGDYVRGASIEACFEAAHETVERWVARAEAKKIARTCHVLPAPHPFLPQPSA
jgi:protoporphyrinogen/coproporphyrinogen III oxidase